MRARVQSEDRTGVDLQRVQQLQSIFLGGRKSSFVRQDAPLIEFLEPHARDESRSMQQPALEVEGLPIVIDSRAGRPLEDLSDQPLCECSFCRAVTIRLAPEFEPHDVVRTAIVQLILTRRSDQIVRWRYYQRRIADDLAVVYQRAKRLDPLSQSTPFTHLPQ